MAEASASDQTFDFKLYRYDVSLPAAAAAVAAFFVLSVLHVWRLLRHRAYYFTPFTIGGFFQVLGYAGRIWSHFDVLAIGGFVIQAILILIAPALYAASIYMILGRLVRAVHAERISVIPIKWMTKIFVVGDVLSFLLQAGGGGIQAAGTLELYNIGEKIIIAGLLVQIIIFGFFMATTVIFNYRQSKRIKQRPTNVPWQRYLNILYTVSTIILIRSIFRVVEYLQGNRGYLISHEIFLYIFDAVLMAAVMAIFLRYYVDGLSEETRGKRDSSRAILSSSGSETMFEMRTPRRKV